MTKHKHNQTTISCPQNVQSQSMAAPMCPFRFLCESVRIWLDETIKNCDDYIDKVLELLPFIESGRLFKSINELDDVKESFLKSERQGAIIIIVSKSRLKEIERYVEDLPQVDSIYVMCSKKSYNFYRIIKHGKIQEYFIEIEDICAAICSNIRQTDTPSISTIRTNQLDSSFMYSQLLKEIILDIDYDDKEKAKNDLRYYYFKHLTDIDEKKLDMRYMGWKFSTMMGTISELNNIDDEININYVNNELPGLHLLNLTNTYNERSPIKWYTMNRFIGRFLNKALSTIDIDIILLMGFFIRDLHEQIKQLHQEQNHQEEFVVYRVHGMFQDEFDKIKNNIGGLIAFNTFLSTTKYNMKTIRIFINRVRLQRTKIPIIFQMKIQPTSSSIPFASIHEFSAYDEDEILFSMNTVFRIDDMMLLNNGIWAINLTLTNDTDPQLEQLTNYMRNQIKGSNALLRLGQLMIKMNEFEKANTIYHEVLKSVSNDDDWQLNTYIQHQIASIETETYTTNYNENKYEKMIKIYEENQAFDHPELSRLYFNIGKAHQQLSNNQRDPKFSMKKFKDALHIELRVQPIDPVKIAAIYNNIALECANQGEHMKAFTECDKAIEYQQNHQLPSLHPSWAMTYTYKGLIHYSNESFMEALPCFQRALEIFNRSLLPNHRLLAITYNNITQTLDKLSRDNEIIEQGDRAIMTFNRAFNKLSSYYSTFENDDKHYINFILDKINTKTNDGLKMMVTPLENMTKYLFVELYKKIGKNNLTNHIINQ